jgi:hypothetical protein
VICRGLRSDLLEVAPDAAVLIVTNPADWLPERDGCPAARDIQPLPVSPWSGNL